MLAFSPAGLVPSPHHSHKEGIRYRTHSSPVASKWQRPAPTMHSALAGASSTQELFKRVMTYACIIHTHISSPFREGYPPWWRYLKGVTMKKRRSVRCSMFGHTFFFASIGKAANCGVVKQIEDDRKRGTCACP